MNCADMRAGLPELAAQPATTSQTAEWRRWLPDEWRDMVIAPIDFTEHREYEMPAKRCFGYDIDGIACYYAHSYSLKECRSDDDEEFYAILAYGEAVRAWRLRDDRWLIYRVVHSASDSAANRGFFTFADQPPR